jgi:hypothetical protein
MFIFPQIKELIEIPNILFFISESTGVRGWIFARPIPYQAALYTSFSDLKKEHTHM